MDVLARYAPRLPALALLHARGHYINGDHAAALCRISDILRTSPGEAEPHLMQSSILLMGGRPQAALNALNAALTSSFAIKAWPQFHVLQGRCLLIQAQVGLS
jgi:predicted Zn-dependent protease